jgi:hypothetical protein
LQRAGICRQAFDQPWSPRTKRNMRIILFGYDLRRSASKTPAGFSPLLEAPRATHHASQA